MQFFEGRIYKPQGKNLKSPVYSRVPVVLGSLSVQNGTIYYCASCEYDESTMMYVLLWKELLSGNSTYDVHNVYEQQECVNVTDGVIEEAVVQGDSGTAHNERIFKVGFSINEDIQPAYPTQGGLLEKILNNPNMDVPTALKYSTSSILNIDGFDTETIYRVTNRVSNTASIRFPQSTHHIVTPIKTITPGKGVHSYIPAHGAYQYIGFFDAVNKTSSIDIPLVGGAASAGVLALIGAHLVFTYRSFIYITTITGLTPGDGKYIISNDDVVCNNGYTGFSIESISAEINETSEYPYNNIDNSGMQFDTKVLTLHIKVSSSTTLEQEKFQLYVKLEPSIVAK